MGCFNIAKLSDCMAIHYDYQSYEFQTSADDCFTINDFLAFAHILASTTISYFTSQVAQYDVSTNLFAVFVFIPDVFVYHKLSNLSGTFLTRLYNEYQLRGILEGLKHLSPFAYALIANAIVVLLPNMFEPFLFLGYNYFIYSNYKETNYTFLIVFIK